MDEISLNHVDDQHGWLWTDTFKTNKKDSKGRAWIVDDFYENPDAVREFALKQYYTCDSKVHGGVGCRTRNPLLSTGFLTALLRVGLAVPDWSSLPVLW